MAAKVKKKTPSRSKDAAQIMNEINAELKLDKGLQLGNDPYFTITRIPTGSYVMDRITGGGLALGRQYEFYGDESSGKSYILYRTMALSQARGNLCAMIDPEHSFDNERFKFLGGRPDELLMQHPANGEEAVAVMMLLAKHSRAREIEVVGIDSVSSLIPRDEAENDPRNEDRMAAQARMMSKALRRINTVNEKTLFIWTNQERTDIGVRFGNPKTTSGGKALRFYATGRIEFRRGAKVTEKKKIARGGKLVETDVTVGRWTQVRVEKDKSAMPNRESSFVFNYKQKKIDIASEIIMLGLEDDMIDRSSTGVYSYTDIDDVEWKGTEKKFSAMLRENEELQLELLSAIADTTQRIGFKDD